MRNSYMFMKNIQGTVAFFRNALNDLLVMVCTLGLTPLCLGADDFHWPELGMMLENFSYEQAALKSSFGQNMRADLLLTAIHFKDDFMLYKNIS